MAPTGRAAKVMSTYTKTKAVTIHKEFILRNKVSKEEFSLSFRKTSLEKLCLLSMRPQ